MSADSRRLAVAPEPPLDRRRFVGGALAGLAGAAACAGPRSTTGDAPAVVSRPSVTWRLASSFPRSLDTIFGSCEVLARRLEAMTEGRFRIRAYPAGELVPGLEVMDAAQQGTVQVAQTASYYFIGKNPAFSFDTCVPFGMTSRQQTAWLTEGGGLERTRRLFADFGILNFPAGNTGAQMGGWFRSELTGLGDLRGLKMRIPGLGGEAMSRLGATVQVLAGGDIYPALERGAIDATEWVGPYDDEKLGFHKVARYYYYPGWWEPGPSLSYLVHRASWDALPVAYQEAFAAAAAESATVMQARYDERNPRALTSLLEQGVLLRRFPDEILVAARDVSEAMLAEHAARDPTYDEIYRAFRAAREAAFRWFGAAEAAYAKFAFPEP